MKSSTRTPARRRRTRPTPLESRRALLEEGSGRPRGSPRSRSRRDRGLDRGDVRGGRGPRQLARRWLHARDRERRVPGDPLAPSRAPPLEHAWLATTPFTIPISSASAARKRRAVKKISLAREGPTRLCERLDPGPPVAEAEPRGGHAEPRVVGCVAQVGAERDRHAAAHAEPMDHRDHRLLDRARARERSAPSRRSRRPPLRRAGSRTPRCPRRDERGVARAAQDHHAHVVGRVRARLLRAGFLATSPRSSGCVARADRT